MKLKLYLSPKVAQWPSITINSPETPEKSMLYIDKIMQHSIPTEFLFVFRTKKQDYVNLWQVVVLALLCCLVQQRQMLFKH